MGELSNLRLFALANRACFEGALRLAGRGAEVEVDFEDAPSNWVRFSIAW
jgi:hypothetical protein